MPVAALDATVPQWLSDLVSKCLERDPELRYQSAQEIVDVIDEAQGTRSSSSYVSQAGGISQTGKIKRRLSVWIAAAVAAMIVGAASAWWFLRSRPETAGTHKPVTVLLADFNNGTSESVFDGTLEPAFTLSLEGAPFVSIFNRSQSRKTVGDLKPGATPSSTRRTPVPLPLAKALAL